MKEFKSHTFPSLAYRIRDHKIQKQTYIQRERERDREREMRMEEGSPEKAEIEKKEEALKSKVAIRCAKAAFLLSSLRSLPNSTADHHHQEKKMLELKIELARERLKNKRIKQCALMELVLELALVLSLSTFFFMHFLNLIEL